MNYQVVIFSNLMLQTGSMRMNYSNIMKLELKCAVKEAVIKLIPYGELYDLDERILQAQDNACDKMIQEWERRGLLNVTNGKINVT